MQQILKGSFGLVVGKRRRYECISFLVGKKGLILREYRLFHHCTHNPVSRALLVRQYPVNQISRRGLAFIVARVLKNVLKVRYLLLGGAVGGGVTLQKKYEEWRDGLPDFEWVKKYVPDPEQVDKFRGSMISMKDRMKDISIDPRLMEAGGEKWRSFQEWMTTRLEEAYEAAEQKVDIRPLERVVTIKEIIENIYKEAVKETTVRALPFSSYQTENSQARIDSLQQEVIEVQLRYQKELEKLEKENRELKKQLLLIKNARSASSKTIQKSLIDMYSEVLDELCDYDQSVYSTQDHLPRVVVVGDQSAGKTSVLEMIAQARIFPRGAGEMMTRAPVKVTLSEGPYHIAQFKDSDREFDLTKEEDLAALRTEVELRMKRSVKGGKTVSNEVISMTVKGPGLQRMVLVDLPGIISTVTKDMAEDTKECIRQMTKAHVSNPNAIILCIQDGSIDAERSNVTDLVSSMDPQGRRTIFVLTKVDLAETNMTNPDRIKKILSGKLFPMKALGYFAVVTGRGKKDDSIQQIKEYEEQFFRNSKLFRDSLMSQVTAKNMSMAVSECFWKMVKETVEQQADMFKANRFNLESEWKNNFPRTRELDRDELFDKARSDILDEVVNLSQVTAKAWETVLRQRIWNKVSDHVFENIYLPSAQSPNPMSFNTLADIRLREWAEMSLPKSSVQAAWETLGEQFSNLVTASSKSSDPLFLPLKEAIVKEALSRHTWESKGGEVLRVIQLNSLDDKCVHDKQQWDSAVRFWEDSIKERLKVTEAKQKDYFGPSTREKWVYWKNSTEEQRVRSAVRSELEKILAKDEDHGAFLSSDELVSVRMNLEQSGYTASDYVVVETWNHVFRKHFLKHSLDKTSYCKKQYFLYHQQESSDEVDCSDVVLFWRIEQMLGTTTRALRQQVMNREARRLDKIIKDVLEDFSQDQEKKVKLLTGRKVILAEQLKRVRQIQDKLEEFIQALNKEK